MLGLRPSDDCTRLSLSCANKLRFHILICLCLVLSENVSMLYAFVGFPREFSMKTGRSQRISYQRHMFTGIVEEMGEVVSFEIDKDMTLWDGTVGKGTELTVKAGKSLEDAYLGCSICVNGVCLTATELTDTTFKVGLAPETLGRTYFADLKVGEKVNLERASEMGGRNSGHFVQGHVDGIGEIIYKQPVGDSLVIRVQTSPEIMAGIVPKGFIAVDGTSLTVVDVNTEELWFSFMLVEYTQKKIIIPAKPIGGKVNLEVDVLGKYSVNMLATTVLPRLEALESKIEKLGRELAKKV